MKRNTQEQYLQDITRKRFSEVFVGFIKAESFSGILLFFCAVCAMLVANSTFSKDYFDFFAQRLGISIGEDRFYGFSIQEWVNDVLMVLFFLMVGLEIKREVLFGDLAGVKKAAFPVIAALGGMVAPGVIYFALNAQTPSWHGFGIPMATDIAFVLGVILLLGKCVPMALKVFLVTLAVADDLGAIMIIATAYPSPEGVHFIWLLLSVVIVSVLIVLNKIGVRNLGVYLLVGALLWFCVHHSGIHATIAGVVLAFCVPVKPKMPSEQFLNLFEELPQKFKQMDRDKKNVLLTREQMDILSGMAKDSINVQNPLLRLEHALQPLCAYFIMPLFAFSNAGVNVAGGIDFGLDYIAPGVFLGLVVGKPIGILLFTFLSEKLGIAARPVGIRWMEILGAGMLAGIGFTMSIFVSNLAFDSFGGGDSQVAEDVAKISILIASSTAGIIGAIFLFVYSHIKRR